MRCFNCIQTLLPNINIKKAVEKYCFVCLVEFLLKLYCNCYAFLFCWGCFNDIQFSLFLYKEKTYFKNGNSAYLLHLFSIIKDLSVLFVTLYKMKVIKF